MGPNYSRLNDYLRRQHNTTFQLGHRDCFTFTNDAWNAMYGHGYADQIIGRYACTGPKRFKQLLVDEFGHDNIVDCLDAHMNRVAGFPPKGALVISSSVGRWITGKALGICAGPKCVFVADKGVVYVPVDKIDGAWTP